MKGKRWLLVALATVCGSLVLGAASAAPPPDHALLALNILPPGEGANAPDLTSQLPLYDGLTPLRGDVTGADLTKFYKPETLGLGGAKPTRVERPKAGVTIDRDKWDVPHIYGKTRADTEFGAGWATAEDRGLDLQLLRGPARISALDVPGYDAFSVALSGRQFVPSAQTESFLAQQIPLAQKTAQGRQLVRDVDSYIAGINAYFKQQGGFVAPFTRNDVVAIGTLIGAVFGAGGGNEAASAEFLASLQQRLGATKGLAVWNDLREQLDPSTPVSIAKSFPYETGPTGVGPGNVALDPGSFTPAGPVVRTLQRHLMSNALLIGASRSSNGHPIFVAGPQVGYYAPEILMEEDLHGGGLDARGVAFPGLGFYLQIGRSADYAWSATSASSDVTDQFVETLCGGDDVHYMFKGTCRAMGTFDAGYLKGIGGAANTELVFHTTVHGPVVGYATSNGTKVAISSQRSTRGRELLGAIPFQTLSTGAVRTPQQFFDTMSKFELTFNWFYADSKHIAMYSSGRLPIRAAGVDPGLPTNGDGSYEWRGFLAPMAHPHVVDPGERRDRQLEQQARGRLRRGGRQLVVRLGAPRPAAGRERRGEEDPDAGERRLRHEPRRDDGSPLDARAAARRRAGSRHRPERARHADARAAEGVERQPARRERRRQDRRSRRGDHGRLVAAARGGRPPAGARPAHRPAEAARADRQSGESERQLLRRRLVLVRGQGSPHAARREGGRQVLHRVLRRRRRRRRAPPRSGSRSTPRATRSPRRRAPIRPRGMPTRTPSGSSSPASSRTRCAGRTARPSSR